MCGERLAGKGGATANYSMMRLARLAVLATLVGAQFSAPAVGASEPPTNVLAGRNTITAQRSGWVDVSLARDVILPLNVRRHARAGPAPWLTFSGDGRVVALVLVKERSTGVEENPTYFDWTPLAAVQFRPCLRDCAHPPVNALAMSHRSFEGKETLHAGNYRLYVVTDGHPVTVSLELRGLPGSAHLRIVEAAPSYFRTPEARSDIRDGVTVHSAGATYRMTGTEGLFLSAAVMSDDEYSGGSFDQCLSPDRPGPDEWQEAACTGGEFFSHRDPARVADPRKETFSVTSFYGLDDANSSIDEGDFRTPHYSFRVVSPGPLSELWSQGVLLTF